MKKSNFLKKIVSIFITFALMTALSVTAFAAGETGSLTLKNGDGSTKTTSTFAAYQLVTWDAELLSAGNTVYTNMQAATGFSTFFTGGYALGTISGFEFDSAQSISLASALENYIADNSIVKYAETTNGVFSSLPYGYYLVTETSSSGTDSTTATKPILVCIPSKAGETNVTVTVKTSTADIDKVIVKNDTDYRSSTEDIGDTVNYRVDASVPTYSENSTDIQYYVTDSMSKGLTFNGTSGLKVYGVSGTGTKTQLTAVIDYTVTTTPDPLVEGTPTNIKIDFVYNKIKGYAKVSLEYSATLNSFANIGSIGNPNAVNLTYTNNSNTGSTYTTADHQVITYTYGIAINKVNELEAELAGAVFALEDFTGNKIATYTYNASGAAVVIDNDATNGISVTTGADGRAHFVGLDEGTYYIHELKAPTGYNLLTERIKIEIIANRETVSINSVSVSQPSNAWYYEINDTVVPSTETTKYIVKGSDLLSLVDVVNTAGWTLPGTGGMGTTLFTILGSGLIIFAGIMLFVYIRKSKQIV